MSTLNPNAEKELETLLKRLAPKFRALVLAEWATQGESIDWGQLALSSAAIDGDTPSSLAVILEQRHRALLSGDLGNVRASALLKGASGIVDAIDGLEESDLQTALEEAADAWIAFLLALLVSTQLKVTGAVLQDVTQRRPLTVRQAALVLRDSVGLNAQQGRLYLQRRRALQDSGFEEPSVQATVKPMTDAMRSERVKRMADSEITGAFAAGAQLAIGVARSLGLLGDTPTLYRWRTRQDDRVCPICGPLHGVTVGEDEAFVTSTGLELSGPPAHPGCRCTLDVDG